VRRDSKSGSKGVRHNAETDTWCACVYRHGNAYHVGTFPYQHQAEEAYEAELRKENPDLHAAPKRVERQRGAGAVPQRKRRARKEGSAGCCLSQPGGIKVFSPAGRR
jgi:hypothetical protein